MKIVKKIWGREEWIVNKKYCGKFLILKKGYRTSLHYHKKKYETFYILKGKVLVEIGNKKTQRKKIMKPGDILHLRPLQVHRISALTPTKIIEFSTQHKDSDSHRLVFGGKIPKGKIQTKRLNNIK